MHQLGAPAFWLIFIGFNLTFLLMHMVGLLGMPRRFYPYPAIESWVGSTSCLLSADSS